MRRQVIHPVSKMRDLGIGEGFGHFFDAAVNVTYMRFNIMYNFTFQFEQQPQNTMSTGVLRTHINKILVSLYLVGGDDFFYDLSHNYLSTT